MGTLGTRGSGRGLQAWRVPGSDPESGQKVEAELAPVSGRNRLDR